MHLDPSLQCNYNGFIHPVYLSHLMPHIYGMPVQIDGLEVAGSNAFEWAKSGVLTDVNLQVAYTPYEALVVKGMGKELADFVRDNEDADHSLAFLSDYYGDDPVRSMNALIGIMNGYARDFVRNIETVAAICIQDLGFTSTGELNRFLLRNLPADERKRASYSLDFFYHNYLRDPADLKGFGASAKSAYDWVRLAVFKANVGDFGAVKRALDRAGKYADRDFYASQMISKNALYLLGDWEMFWASMNTQIDCCTDSFCFLESVEDLCLYVGTDEAIKMAHDLMHLAELASDGADDLLQISVSWEKHFQDDERARTYRKIAEIQKKPGDARHEDD